MTAVDPETVSNAITKQFQNQVAFFNIGKEHAFFFCSPDEARHAMDAVREFREHGHSLRLRGERREDLVKKLTESKAWENSEPSMTVISVGNGVGNPCPRLSISALSEAFKAIEDKFRINGPIVDVVIMSALRFGDIRAWGTSIYNPASAEDVIKRRVFGNIWNADIYIRNAFPNDRVVVASGPCTNWDGAHSAIRLIEGQQES